MRIGYSFWGFLFNGVKDSPDGGRIHRYTFLNALIEAGFTIVCLQKNRDLHETNQYKEIRGINFISDGLPKIDALICEYRWPIPGRNTEGDAQNFNFTPDLRRQTQILDYYRAKIPVFLWDKDLKIDVEELSGQTIFEAGLCPRKGSQKLLFSFDEFIKDKCLAELGSYSSSQRSVDLIYIGNQYERDESFAKYIEGSGQLLQFKPQVYGNWTKYKPTFKENIRNFQNVKFHDRIRFSDLANYYGSAFATVLIAPQRYYEQGQITQRIFEALASHVIPFVPSEYKHVDEVILEELRVTSPEDIVRKIHNFKQRGDNYIRHLISQQVKKLECYAPSLQANAILYALKGDNNNVY